jgi:hypothetical protein
MRLIDRLQEELKSLIKLEASLSSEEFPIDTEIENGESVTLIYSQFEDGLLEHIYSVAEKDGSVSYISSSHSDGGVVVFQGGPWKEARHLPSGWRTEY